VHNKHKHYTAKVPNLQINRTTMHYNVRRLYKTKLKRKLKNIYTGVMLRASQKKCDVRYCMNKW